MSSAELIINPIWRGSFRSHEEFGRVDGLVAHLSTKASLEVSTVESLLSSPLVLDFLPSPDVWQQCFGSSMPTDDKIDLYFFPKNGSSHEKDYYTLLDKMYREDLAARTEVENGDIFLFTSLIMPSDYKRFKRQHYIWGVYVEKKAQQMDFHDFGSSNSLADECLGDGEHVTSPTKASQLDVRRGPSTGDTGSNHEFSDRSTDARFLDVVKAFDEREPSADTNSVMCRSVVQVGPYAVEASLGRTLEAIFDKYGDIARECPIQSNTSRTRFLEDFCREIEELKEVEFCGCRRSHLQSLHTAVTNAENVGLNVAWLRQRYDELRTMYEGIKDYTTEKNHLDKSMVVEEFRKKSLDSKEGSMMKVKSETETVRGQSSCLQEEIKDLENEMSRRRGRASRFLKKSLDDGLL